MLINSINPSCKKSSGGFPFTSIRKVRPDNDFLYEATFDNLDYDYANAHIDEINPVELNRFACSAVRNGDFYGRNFDWSYSNDVEFIVKTDRLNHESGGRYASIGVCGNVKGLTKEFVESKQFSEQYKLIPFRVVDGINEKGLVVNDNVVPYNDSENHAGQETTPTISQEDSVNGYMLVRYILDKFDTAEGAVKYIKEHVKVVMPQTLLAGNYALHYMVADKNATYIMEMKKVGDNYIMDYAEHDIMTNFYVNDVDWDTLGGNDSIVPTPETHVDGYAPSQVGISPLGDGLERFNLIVNDYDDANDKDGMRDLMNSLMYTRSYPSCDLPDGVAIPTWYTEFVGNGLTVDSSQSDFNNSGILQIADQWYLNRDRSSTTNVTWQTVHSSVYDIKNKKLYLISQENLDSEFEYSFDYEASLVWEQGSGEHSIQTKDTGCDARGDYSVAEGNGTLAESDLSHAEGWASRTIIDDTDSETHGHASHAEGSHTIAKGAASHAEGNTTESIGMYSHAEGSGSISGGRSSHAEGNGTLTENVAEHAEGTYNKSHSVANGDAGSTLHSIGIGTSMTDRKNAFEVLQNGNAYLLGVGGYDGENIDSAETLQTVINEGGSGTTNYNELDNIPIVNADLDADGFTPVEGEYYLHKSIGGDEPVYTPFEVGQTYDKIYFDTSKSIAEMTTIINELDWEHAVEMGGTKIISLVTATDSDLFTAHNGVWAVDFLDTYIITTNLYDSLIWADKSIGSFEAGWTTDETSFDTSIVAYVVNNQPFMSATPFPEPSQFTNNTIYHYINREYKIIDNIGGGGMNKYMYSFTSAYDFQKISRIMSNAKGRVLVNLQDLYELNHSGNARDDDAYEYYFSMTSVGDGMMLMVLTIGADSYSCKQVSISDGNFSISDVTDHITEGNIIYFNDNEIM